MALISFVCYVYAATIIIFKNDFWSVFFGDYCELYWDEMHNFFSMLIAGLLFAYALTYDFGHVRAVQAFIWAMCFIGTTLYSTAIAPLFVFINMGTGFVVVLYVCLAEMHYERHNW